ncbi:MAG: hypothetical protein M1833_000630 [Piccolia ochrophora]|nr:MAG: hypothetical protein M1833_000630 [Piccolia ochrophora]
MAHPLGAIDGEQAAGGSNARLQRPLQAGVYAPALTFFDPETEDLDVPTIRKHAVRLVRDGLAGLVIMGSNGEAVHLDRAERQKVVQSTRAALDEAGFTQVPLIVGTGDQSTRGTLELCKDAAAAGGDYVLVVPPSYFRNGMTDDALYDHYSRIADSSPVPVLLYNYPGAVAGIDLDSDLIIKVSQHPNVVGTKFTCGNTGKLTRVASGTNAKTPKDEGSGYMAFGGLADFTLQTFVSGGSGIIAGSANVFPKSCVHVLRLYTQGKIEEAMKVQMLLSEADGALTKGAVAGTKSALQHYAGYGGYPRRPLQHFSDEQARHLNSRLSDIMAFEKTL